VKARNGKKLKMLNLKLAWISDPAANTMQTAVYSNSSENQDFRLKRTREKLPVNLFQFLIPIPSLSLSGSPWKYQYKELQEERDKHLKNIYWYFLHLSQNENSNIKFIHL